MEGSGGWGSPPSERCNPAPGHLQTGESGHQSNPEPGARMSEYVAWDGETYQGQPPEGWVRADDGRWWPAESLPSESHRQVLEAPPPPIQQSPPPGPQYSATPSQRRWYQKKRFVIPIVGFVGLAIAGAALGSDPADDVQTAANDQPEPEPTTTTVLETTSTTEVEAATDAPPQADTELPDDLKAEAFRQVASGPSPAVVFLSDEDVEELADIFCAAASESATGDELALVLALTWADLSETERLLVDNDLENFGALAGAAVGVYCPEESDRLGF